jgi:hypothetical protein
VKAARGDGLDVRVRNAEDIGVGDGLGGESGADDIADAAAHARRGAAVGLDRGGVVVGLDLDADGVVFVERDNARVVDEHGERPVDALLDEFVRRGRHRALEEVVDDDRSVGESFVTRAVGPVDAIARERVARV